MKAHIGNGTIYLKDFVNVDVEIPEHALAKDRPDLVEINGTDIEHYYKNEVTKEDILSGKFHTKEVVTDAYGDVFNLPFDKNSLEEVRLVQVFEHLTFEEGERALKYWLTKLADGGKLHLDIPDLDGTIGIYLTDPEWSTRLLFGSQRNQYGQHKSMYNKKTIKEKLEKAGYKNIAFLPNIHFYPAFAVEAVKQ